MAHSHNDDTHACCQTNISNVQQSFDEMVFERGLWQAALDGDVERVEVLLKRGHDVRVEDSAGYTPLHYAARNGHYRVCEILLQHGADVDAITPCIQATPLHRAAVQGHAETVETLLRHGANANLKDTDGKTALHRAISKHASSIETLQDTSFSDTCTLLLPHTDLNIKDNSGQTPKELISRKFVIASQYVATFSLKYPAHTRSIHPSVRPSVCARQTRNEKPEGRALDIESVALAAASGVSGATRRVREIRGRRSPKSNATPAPSRGREYPSSSFAVRPRQSYDAGSRQLFHE